MAQLGRGVHQQRSVNRQLFTSTSGGASSGAPDITRASQVASSTVSGGEAKGVTFTEHCDSQGPRLGLSSGSSLGPSWNGAAALGLIQIGSAELDDVADEDGRGYRSSGLAKRQTSDSGSGSLQSSPGAGACRGGASLGKGVPTGASSRPCDLGPPPAAVARPPSAPLLTMMPFGHPADQHVLAPSAASGCRRSGSGSHLMAVGSNSLPPRSPGGKALHGRSYFQRAFASASGALHPPIEVGGATSSSRLQSGSSPLGLHSNPVMRSSSPTRSSPSAPIGLAPSSPGMGGRTAAGGIEARSHSLHASIQPAASSASHSHQALNSSHAVTAAAAAAAAMSSPTGLHRTSRISSVGPDPEWGSGSGSGPTYHRTSRISSVGQTESILGHMPRRHTANYLGASANMHAAISAGSDTVLMRLSGRKKSSLRTG